MCKYFFVLLLCFSLFLLIVFLFLFFAFFLFVSKFRLIPIVIIKFAKALNPQNRKTRRVSPGGEETVVSEGSSVSEGDYESTNASSTKA